MTRVNWFILVLVFSGSIILLLLIAYSPVFDIRTAAQINNNHNDGTNPVLKAIQGASQVGGEYLRANVTIKGFELNTEIPVTSELMSKGLSVKNQLKENEAMLFVFEEPARHSFWMKDMKFPIDIIWLDSNGKIVHIEGNLEPCPLVFVCPGYAPNVDSQYVLETVAGFTQRHNISVGTNVDFKLIR